MAPKNKNFWHPVWDKCHLTWKEKFPKSEYKHIMWNDDKIDQFIETEFSDYVNFYYSLPFHIMQLDFARICILYKYGGIYADMDQYCFENFYDDLNRNLALVESASTVDETIQNSLMASTKNNKHLKKIIDQCVENFYYYEIINDFNDKEQNFYVREICGPLVLTKYYDSLDDKQKEEIQILEKELYNHNTGELNPKTMHFLTGIWGKELYKNIFQHIGKIGKNKSIRDQLLDNWKNMRSNQHQKFLDIF